MAFDMRAAVGSLGVIAFLVVILVAIGACSILIPVVMNTSNSSALGLTGGTAIMVDLIPTLFFFLMIVGGVSAIVVSLSRR